MYDLAKKLETEMWEAAVNHDESRFLELVEEDAVMVCGGYRCLGKEYAGYIKEDFISAYQILTFEVISADANFLQVHYVVKTEAEDSGAADVAGKFHVTSTWRKTGERYKLIFNMDSRI